MNTDVLFETAAAAKKTFGILQSEGLLNNIRFFISPERPEGLETSGFMLLFPYVMREENEDRLDHILDREKPEKVLVRNMEELAFLRDRGFKGEIHADYSLYSFNRESIKVLKELGVSEFTCPPELNVHELKERGLTDSSLVIYGRTPLMISAQCTNKTVTGRCRREKDGFRTEITDRKGVKFPVRAECAYCYNVIYNSVPLSLFKDMEEIRGLDPKTIRMDFTFESAGEASGIIESFIRGDFPGLNSLIPEYTRGHYKKGAE